MAWELGHTIAATVVCASTSYALYTRSTTHGKQPASSTKPPQAYILNNQVTHSRILPVESRHVFSYPTLSFLLSLHALERNKVDLGRGWLFGYGGVSGRLTGLRSSPYVTHVAGKAQGELGIKEKLVGVLRDHASLEEEEGFEDGWIMTMPAILGYEGINPLTVYFCYKEGMFWAVVLEIHNTFSESHIHICEVGKDQDPEADKGYTHQWTFLREFHVSPFNDRSGFYTVSVQSPTHPPDAASSQQHDQPPSSLPRPSVRVRLYQAQSHPTPDPFAEGGETQHHLSRGALKLSAVLHMKHSKPLTPSTLLASLARAPFLLFLSMPRILYQAWILHYRKRLDVWVRPDPLGVLGSDSDETASNNGLADDEQRARGVGVKWQTATALERFAQGRIEYFLGRRCREFGVTVKLVAGDPSVADQVFSGEDNQLQYGIKLTLVIHYRSTRFFTAVYMAPSATHALLFGAQCTAPRHRLFSVSDENLFSQVFSLEPRTEALNSNTPHDLQVDTHTPDSQRLSTAQTLRCRPLPLSIHPPSVPIPNVHPLDQRTSAFVSTAAVQSCLLLDRVEEGAFWLAGARVIPGDEPWKAWERAADVFTSQG